MPATADPIADLDLTVLEDLDFDATPKCDGEGCKNDANYLITCPCGEGTEYVCNKCLSEMREAAAANFLHGALTFNKSCGHTTLVQQCQVRPI